MVKRHNGFKKVKILVLLSLLIAVLTITTAPINAELIRVNILTSKSELQNTHAKTENLLQQGKALYDAGKFAEAVKVLKQANAAFETSGNKANQVVTLSNLALTYQQMGQLRDAEAAITRSLNLVSHSQISNSDIVAQTLDVQGKLQLEQGKTEAALETWRQSANIYKKNGNEALLIRNHVNSASAMQLLGLYHQAKTVLTEVEQSLTKQPDSLVKATGLLSLGNVLRVVGNLNQSRAILEESRKVASNIQASTELGDILLSLGNTTLAQYRNLLYIQNNEAAKKLVQQTLEYYRQAELIASPTTRIQAHLNKFRLLIDDKEISTALTLLPQIESELKNLSPSRNSIYAQINFAESLIKLQNNNQSIGLSLLDIAKILSASVQQAQILGDKRAESHALGTLGRLYEQSKQLAEAQKLTQKALLIASSLQPGDITYQWLWQLGRLLNQQGDTRGAISYYQEAFKTLESLRRDLLFMNPEIQFSFRDMVEPVYRELVGLQLYTNKNYQPSFENLKQARYVIESLQLAELDNFFRQACLRPKVNIDQVVDKKDRSAAFIYPIVLKDRIEVILKLPGRDNLVHNQVEIAQSQVEDIIDKLRGDLQEPDYTSQVQEESGQIYDWLIRPFETQLTNNKIKTLVFVLDASLRNIPMAVLYNKQQDKYLIEKYAIALTPGLQLIDPQPLQKVQINALTAGVGEKRVINNQLFAPLKNVPQELKQVKLEIPRSKELLNQEFTQKNLQTQLQEKSFSIVHLATHGEFSSDPEKTFILTWDGLLKVRDFEKLLRTTDRNSLTHIELLVLSACETAEGDKRAALGLAGIAVKAGARSTLASLWSVEDYSTTFLMGEFYQKLNTGMSKAEALRQAQLAVLQKDKKPFNWAPYVLVGNWL
ncbi:MAG: CHAT domain-containing protein [Calothrix sp. FI2-JRJ7]|jgi:CHAT domain-containing protein/predicted negative regulator of RcsB-dependent stress response|nr:CHAT domain-containing protein [Calothrix sp. FI2-JRJ7]